MKKLLLLTLLSTTGFSMGSVTLNQELATDSQNFGPRTTLSFYIEQPLITGVYYSSWTGIRFGDWFSTGHMMMFNVTNKLDLGVGPSINKTVGSEASSAISIQGTYRLW